MLYFYDFNFLILDEPTNHLDLNSKEILKDALKLYEGTLLLVSHDRDFLDGLSNKIWEIKDGQMKTHLFGVNEFLKRIGTDLYDEQDKKRLLAKTQNPSTSKQKSVDQEVLQRIKKLETKIKNSERKITDLEAKLKTCTDTLESTDYNDSDNYQKALAAYTAAETTLNSAVEAWEAQEMELDDLKATL